MEINESFDGVFRFTNATSEDFTALWNNKEYVFPAKTCCPIIIANETLENIQAIRKKFAYKLATREFYKGRDYTKLSKMGNGMPPTFDEKVLQPWIDECLKPLPEARATIKQRPGDSAENYRATKAISIKDNPNYEFREEADNALAVGVQPDKEIG